METGRIGSDPMPEINDLGNGFEAVVGEDSFNVGLRGKRYARIVVLKTR